MPKTGGYGYMLVFSKQQMQNREKALKCLVDMSRDGPPDPMSKLLRAHEADQEKITKEDIFALGNLNAFDDSVSAYPKSFHVQPTSIRD